MYIYIYGISAERPEDGTCSKERARQTVLGTPWQGRAQILIILLLIFTLLYAALLSDATPLVIFVCVLCGSGS